MEQYQTIVVLGGGFSLGGSLTNLSIQRLDASVELYRANQSATITVLGGFTSTYLPNAIGYEVSGAQKGLTT